MPRVSPIKWNDNQRALLSKQVKRFNAKLTREAKRSPEKAQFLPPKLSVKELKQQIKTSKDLRLFSSKVDRAFKPKAFDLIMSKNGVITTQYQVQELKLDVRRINQARKREAEKANVSTEKGTMGTIEANNLRPKRFDFDNIKPKDWDKFVESVEKQAMVDSYNLEKILKYKEDYLRSVQDLLGSYGRDLYEFVSKLPADFIYGKFYDDTLLQISFISDPIPAREIAESALEAWKRTVSQELDNL